MLKDIILKNRSYRRFYEDEEISYSTLKELVDLARLSPSASNKQPLKYYLSYSKETNAQIFPHLKWAGYLKEWPGPGEGERPSAYIVVLGDTSITVSFALDLGIASQSILLGAAEKGLGGCIIGSVQKSDLKEKLKFPAEMDVLHVIALGRPKEIVDIEEMKDGNVKYWRDGEQHHHVPKRSIDEIIINKEGEK